jgi:hypothetical protein
MLDLVRYLVVAHYAAMNQLNVVESCHMHIA